MDEDGTARNIADTTPFFVHKKARAPAVETRAIYASYRMMQNDTGHARAGTGAEDGTETTRR